MQLLRYSTGFNTERSQPIASSNLLRQVPKHIEVLSTWKLLQHWGTRDTFVCVQIKLEVTQAPKQRPQSK